MCKCECEHDTPNEPAAAAGVIVTLGLCGALGAALDYFAVPTEIIFPTHGHPITPMSVVGLILCAIPLAIGYGVYILLWKKE